ncbi:signal peptidase I [Bacteroidales bacterium]|nr:signal peptidase I [Bacteroidales bacterium]
MTNNTEQNKDEAGEGLIDKKKSWIKFSIVASIYLLFAFWHGNFWMLLGLPFIFDIYVSKKIPWGAWKKSKNPHVKKIAEWVDAIVFALIAVYIINLYIFQNYQIPTASLEKSLLVGDFLFVSKMSYGPRVPNTPLSFPLAQHTLPFFDCKSYFDWPQWDYKRVAGFGTVKRKDIVVFNFPTGDTVTVKVNNPDYYYLCLERGRDAVWADKQSFGEVVYRPVDRRENYVKRCIGMPGDSLQIIDNAVYIDGQMMQNPEQLQFNYFVETSGMSFSDAQFRKLDVSVDDRVAVHNADLLDYLGFEPQEGGNFNPVYNIPLTKEAYKMLVSSGWMKKIVIEPDVFGGPMYPLTYNTGWTRDNYGPLWIPKKGESISLNALNIGLYSRCIVNYEGNTMRIEGDNIFINEQAASSYTFKYDYYFMMGDNRHKSADSRSWGFVPEDHVVGKPILVWLSLDKDRGWFDGGIRWNRIFKMVDKI